ncbi:MAG: NAD(P)/FAD-dependent oxidoreductase [Chitinophagaceae bacterium]
MQRELPLQLSPTEASQPISIRERIAEELGIAVDRITGYQPLKQSIDARSKRVRINLRVAVTIDEPFEPPPLPSFAFPEVHHATHRVVIVGAGPAGLFAALKLLQKGIKPIILERGKDVRERRRDLAALNRLGELNENSNYCFGEGGAGTYSDGKLYTRSNKRGSVNEVLELLVFFGADPSILYTAHPHIGTNKLPQIITAMRECIQSHGGEVHFNEQVTDLQLTEGRIRSLTCNSGNVFEGDAIILATGHSAKDIFYLLHQKKILIEPKPFALGVRIEHPQTLIDSIQYHCPVHQQRDPHLPPASYALVEQVKDRGVFSFCMCPGGIIATASTLQGSLVVNGWSPSKRNNPFANSGMVVQVELKDALAQTGSIADPLMLHRFQEAVERKAFEAGGGKYTAPAQRMTDLILGKTSTTLPETSYLRGIHSANMKDVLPEFVFRSLQKAFLAFGKKMKGYLTDEAVVVAPESRTSSPVRIPRDSVSLQHPHVHNLYPCGEGAGYAGGIVSAAMDGQKVADRLSSSF